MYYSNTCPHGAVCDPPSGGCVAPAPQTSGCQLCLKVVNYIEEHGCVDLCKELPIPGADILCEIIEDLGVCSDIVKWIQSGWSSVEACGMVGYCGSGTCKCGYCTPPLYANYCLSLPNECPKTSYRRVFEQWMHDERHSPNAAKKKKRLGGTDVCVDGWCDASTLGCCLTCAP
jgi:hypothetical protein